MLVALGVIAQLAIVAHAPDTVNACQAVEVSVAISAPDRGIPRLVTPSFHPFDVLRGTTTPRVQRRSPQSFVTEYRYTITTDRVGQYTIPPFEARVGGTRVVSRPLTLTVREPRGRVAPAVVTRARIDTSASPGLLADPSARTDTVFIGQQATYEVAVFLNAEVRQRLRRNPTFYPPDMQAVLAYDLPAMPLVARQSGSTCFDALVYRRALFPLTAGRLAIPPAQLVYNMSISPLMYRAEESHELQTDSVTIIAVEPPAAGRPPEYAGAVGSVRVDASLDSTDKRVGDPMLFTVRVTGAGNVKLFPRPAVRMPWAGLVPADERVSMDSSSARIGGVKEFDWVLTPRIAGEFDVPPVRYGYFDPSRRRYDVAVAPASRVRIGSGALASSDTGDAEAVLDIRTRYGGRAWPPLQSRATFWFAMALIPVPAIVSRARRRVAQRRKGATENPMRALLGARPSDDAVRLRRQFVRALALRLGCNPEDFTHPGALDRSLRRSGVSRETAANAEALLRELDSAAYARSGSVPRGAGMTARAVARAVDEEALARSELPFWVPLAFFVLSLGLAANAAAADTAATHFSRGVSAYLRAQYDASRDAFAAAVSAEPASPDAWANFGTASWTLADTSAAVLGWRQALAIQPGAVDLQDRMGLLGAASPSEPGWVPSLPRNASVWLFAGLWVAAWALAFLAHAPRWREQFGWMSRWPLPLAGTALVVGVLAVELETRIAGARLGIVRGAVALSSDPAMGMDRGPALATGEIVTIAARRGGWTRVEARGDREGWIAASQLYLVDARRIPRD
ncbi:MAG: BatD family protein [Gemmatimonadaceae bacterium]